MSTRNQVFISYAHADAEWRDQFAEMLNPAVERGSISLWSDRDIAVGQDWSKNIERALNSAGVGLLLVSPKFLNSEFITDVELKRLLSLAQTAETAIFWVPISPTLYEETPLGTIQAAWDPANPLEGLAAPERNAAVKHICVQIVEDFGFLPKMTGGRRQRLPQEVQHRLGDKYELGDEVGAGRFSIVYRAQQKNPNRTVGIKVLVASEFDDWARQKFQDAAEKAAELVSPAFIKIIESSVDEQPQLLVTEFIQGEPLSKYLLRYPTGVPLRIAKTILLDLASAIEEIHRNKHIRGELCSSNILVESTGAARMSAADFATILTEESQMAGNFLVDRESLAYMTPERFFGRAPSQLSDQYSLGLIAMELLGGERVPRVSSASDLEGKRRLFADLQSGKGRWANRSVEFAGIVCRMLRTEPTERWASMRDVRHFLRDVQVAESEEEMNRRLARTGYLKLQRAGTERYLFKRFYENLFATCPDVKRHFADLNMERQYQLLNRAILLLLDFDPGRGSTELRDLASRHAPFGLTRRHYDLFLASLLKTIDESSLDDNEIVAWRKTLPPAVDFMCTCQGMPASAENVQSLGV